ncbi:MAG: hypothetical protein ACK515_09075 [bacterium]|jgi:hypothetical protein|nr:hypothetical protein [Betaproteobacteria bacterium]
MSLPPADDAVRMAIVDKVQRLDELQADELDARRRAARRAWMFVLLAGVVLALIVAGFSWQVVRKRAELAALTAQASTAQSDLAALDARIAGLKAREAELDRNVQSLTRALSQLPKAQLEAAVDSAWGGQNPPAQWVPRVYMQIVAAEDRAWAGEIARRLREGGLIVPGIELVAKHSNLSRSDVRYFRKADQAGAQAIVDRLAAMGVTAVPSYVTGYEDSSSVRPNQFEIWFRAGAREQPVR